MLRKEKKNSSKQIMSGKDKKTFRNRSLENDSWKQIMVKKKKRKFTSKNRIHGRKENDLKKYRIVLEKKINVPQRQFIIFKKKGLILETETMVKKKKKKAKNDIESMDHVRNEK